MFNFADYRSAEPATYGFKYSTKDHAWYAIAQIAEDAAPIPVVDAGPEITAEFNVFKATRPEYLVYSVGIEPSLLTDAHDSQELLDARIHTYTQYLAGAMMLHGSTEAQVEHCIKWLGDSGFYDAPASTRYHESFPGGLLLHSLRVLNQIIQLAMLPAFESVDLKDAVLIALAHDWCKIGKYEQYMKNVKNEITGVWSKEPAYRYSSNGTTILAGHGTASMYILMKWVKVRLEESLAVRWHMGHWYVSDNDINDLQQCNENYPLVHMLQFADQLAITNYSLSN